MGHGDTEQSKPYVKERLYYYKKRENIFGYTVKLPPASFLPLGIIVGGGGLKPLVVVGGYVTFPKCNSFLMLYIYKIINYQFNQLASLVREIEKRLAALKPGLRMTTRTHTYTHTHTTLNLMKVSSIHCTLFVFRELKYA